MITRILNKLTDVFKTFIHDDFNQKSKIINCLCVLFLFAACNEQLDLPDREYSLNNDLSISHKKGRLLLVVIDGASGEAVKNAINTRNAQNLRRMLGNSLYTFEGLADAQVPLETMSVERAWANLLTGSTAHDVGLNGNGITALDRPSFMTMAKTGNPEMKTALFASTEAFYNTFKDDVDDASIKQNNDIDVANAVRAELRKSDPADLIVVQFNTPQIMGEIDGFFETDLETTPTQAIIRSVRLVDRLIGNIVETMEARSNYENENWLLVVTSSYGGEYPNEVEGSFFYDFPDRNIFTMMYNARFEERMLLQPVGDDARRYHYTSAYFSGRGQQEGATNAMMDDDSFFEIGQRRSQSPSVGANAYPRLDDNDYTIAFKVLSLITGRNYASILSKGNARNAAQGWRVAWGDTDVTFQYGGLQSVDNPNRAGGSVLSTGNNRASGGPRHTGWLNFHIVIKSYEPRDRSNLNNIQYSDTAYLYMNGELQERKAINGFFATQYMANATPSITIGDNNNDWDQAGQRFVMTDLQFYNIAMDADFIAENHCQIRIDDIKDEWPYWDNLLAYYPNDRVDDIGLSYIRDYSQYASSRKNLYFNRMHSGWIPNNPNPPILFVKTSGSQVSPHICPRPDDTFYKQVLNTVDIASQTMMWLGISIRPEWGLEGQGWPVTYFFME